MIIVEEAYGEEFERIHEEKGVNSAMKWYMQTRWLETFDDAQEG